VLGAASLCRAEGLPIPLAKCYNGCTIETAVPLAPEASTERLAPMLLGAPQSFRSPGHQGAERLR
jgi:hypothetical protein